MAVGNEAPPPVQPSPLAALRAAAVATALPDLSLMIRALPGERLPPFRAGLVTHIDDVPVREIPDIDATVNRSKTLTVVTAAIGERPLLTTWEWRTCWHPGQAQVRFATHQVRLPGATWQIAPHEDVRLAVLRAVPEGPWDADLAAACDAYDHRDGPALLAACRRVRAAGAVDAAALRMLGVTGALYAGDAPALEEQTALRPEDPPLLAHALRFLRQSHQQLMSTAMPATWRVVQAVAEPSCWTGNLARGGANYLWGDHDVRIAWTLPATEIDVAWRVRLGDGSPQDATPRHLRIAVGDPPRSADEAEVIRQDIRPQLALTVVSSGHLVAEIPGRQQRGWWPAQAMLAAGVEDHLVRVRVQAGRIAIWWDGVLAASAAAAPQRLGVWLQSQGVKAIVSDLVAHAPGGPQPLALTQCMLANDPQALALADPGWVLRQAAFSGRLPLVDAVLDRHPELVDAVDPDDRWSALSLAAFAGHQAIVTRLLQAKADMRLANRWSWLPADYAVTMGQPWAGVLVPPSGFETVLLRSWRLHPTALAPLAGHLPASLSALLVQGDVDAALAGDRDPRLAFAALEAGMEHVLPRLRDAGVDLNRRWPGTDETLLHWAIARRRDPAVARFVAGLGVDVHARAIWGDDAIETARKQGLDKLAQDLDTPPPRPEGARDF